MTGDRRLASHRRRAPRGIVSSTTRHLLQAVETIQRMRTGQATPDMTAALADITRSANPARIRPKWLGSSGMVPAISANRADLHAVNFTRVAVGWRFTKKPEVDDEGDKIIHRYIATSRSIREASRRGPWHRSRIFRLPEREFLEAFLTPA